MNEKIELLKTHVTKGDKTYTNIYIRINGGAPIAINMVNWNKSIFGLLCAVATEVEIKKETSVSEVK